MRPFIIAEWFLVLCFMLLTTACVMAAIKQWNKKGGKKL